MMPTLVGLIVMAIGLGGFLALVWNFTARTQSWEQFAVILVATAGSLFLIVYLIFTFLPPKWDLT